MSHELEFVNNEAAIAYSGSVPWHGLGVQVPADLTPEQMLDAAKLNWTVEKRPCYVYDNFQDKYVDAGITALVRSSDNRVLTHVADSWNPMNNIDAFRFFNEYVMAGDMEMNTAGSLHGGRIVWALAKIKKSFELTTAQGKDQVDSYLLFTNPHKFGQSIDVRFTPIRVVCNNTLTMAIEHKVEAMVKVNHKNKFDEQKVKETLGIANRYMEQYEDMANFLASRNYTKDSLRDYFSIVFPKNTKDGKESDAKNMSRNAEIALNVIETQPGATLGEGSWWQAYNATIYICVTTQ
jgi:hypothetical protein